MDGELAFELGEGLEILAGDALADGLLERRVDEGHAAALEAGAAEASAVDAVGMLHYLIQGCLGSVQPANRRQSCYERVFG